MPKYQRSIVVFLDILGFSGFLEQFEREALKNHDETSLTYHQSESLNSLLSAFEENIKLIESKEKSYYVFSDNICITTQYEENADNLIDVLILISTLSYRLADAGFLFRGGVDIGWFADDQTFAVGKPLASAYKLEREKAIYPRVILSKEYLRTLSQVADDLRSADKFDESIFPLESYYVRKDGPLRYLNPFGYATNFEDSDSRIRFLKTYRKLIKRGIKHYAPNSKVGRKYRWLRREFNQFLLGLSTIENELFVEEIHTPSSTIKQLTIN